MAQEKIDIDQFLLTVKPSSQEFVIELHEYLLTNQCKFKIEAKSSGLFISYTDATTKKSIVNLLFRKKGLIARVYATNVQQYLDFLALLPFSLKIDIQNGFGTARSSLPATR